MFKPGQSVVVSPLAYPGQKWPGTVKRKTSSGYSIHYESWGAKFTGTFDESQISAA